MQNGCTQSLESAPGTGTTGRYSISAEFSELASAVSALTADELNGLSDALGTTGGWDTDGGSEHGGQLVFVEPVLIRQQPRGEGQLTRRCIIEKAHYPAQNPLRLPRAGGWYRAPARAGHRRPAAGQFQYSRK